MPTVSNSSSTTSWAIRTNAATGSIGSPADRVAHNCRSTPLHTGNGWARWRIVMLAPGAVEYRGWSNGAAVGEGVQPYPAGVRVDLGDPLDWDALLHHWRFTLTRLAEQYVAGEARVGSAAAGVRYLSSQHVLPYP